VSNDPVEFDEGQWWFWDESWSQRLGPFESEAEARDVLRDYCEWLNTGASGRALGNN
jgi:hypothetical protein